MCLRAHPLCYYYDELHGYSLVFLGRNYEVEFASQQVFLVRNSIFL